jgi:hypothetical protein
MSGKRAYEPIKTIYFLILNTTRCFGELESIREKSTSREYASLLQAFKHFGYTARNLMRTFFGTV